MPLPTVLMRVVDPAQVYFDKTRPSRRRRSPTYRGGAVFGPGIDGGSRQATDAEINEIRRRAEPSRNDYAQAQEETLRRWSPELHQAADQVIASGTANIATDSVTAELRLLRFWRGDSILEVIRNGDVSGAARVARHPRRDELVHHLASWLTQA